MYPMSAIKSNDNIMHQSKTHKFLEHHGASGASMKKWNDMKKKHDESYDPLKRGWEAVHYLSLCFVCERPQSNVNRQFHVTTL